MRDAFSLYFYYCKTSMKAWFQYRVDAFLRIFAVMARESTAVIIMYITFLSFKNIGGWTINELLFLFSFMFLTYGIFIIFFTGLRDFQYMVIQGDLDKLLIRPRGVLFQLLASNSDWFAALGHGLLGIVVFIYSSSKISIEWTMQKIILACSCVCSGVLIQALINGSIDNRQLKDLAKKILNINKYKTVMLNELSINMMENGYDTIYINRIKELADLLYAEWSDYVTVSVSKIKRKRFDSPEAVTESIEKMEDEIVSITKGYIDFLEKDEGTDRENKKISNEIIFVEEGKIIFSITDGKTHNFWFEDKAPKYPLLKNCNDDKIFAKARILFNQESEENLYQAGIYVKSAEDKVYYMAIDNDRNCILDTIGENNRKEEFDNTNEYLIKMNLEADCLKVQFISDASTKELKMMIERLAPVEVGLMVKTWGNGGFLEVDFKESQAIISNK